MNNISRYITVKEAAKRLGSGVQLIYNAVKTEKLSAVHLDNRGWLIDEADFEQKKQNLCQRYRVRSRVDPVEMIAYVDSPLRSEAIEIARTMNISVSELINRALVKYVEEAKKNG